jgi:hypothetical protein
LKQLVFQVLKLNYTMLNERSASRIAAQFQSEGDEQDWFYRLGYVLAGLPQIYAMVDMEIMGKLANGRISWPDAFTTLFEELRSRRISTVLKVILLSYRPSTVLEPPPSSSVIKIPNKIPARAKLNNGKPVRRRGNCAIPIQLFTTP